ncbi:MAG: CoA transferase [Novosphingobium sp.]
MTGPRPPVAIPLAAWADRQLAAFARLAPDASLDRISGAGLLGERAALNGFVVPDAVSAGGGCRLLATADSHVALNLAREEDRTMLPALFGDGALDPADDAAITEKFARSDALTIVSRAREMGLAVAALAETAPCSVCAVMTRGPRRAPAAEPPLVIDLAALWAGPLAGSLLALAGARVIKVESRTRPDAMRQGDAALFARLNAGKDSVCIDFGDAKQREALLRLLSRADIVIEAARPRALLQLGIDADALVRAVPGLVWVTITGHGTCGEAADWVGFGDDCGVAGGLSGALLAATGTIGFVGDAIADPLTGLAAARLALARYRRGAGGRLGLSMAGVVAAALAYERRRDPEALAASLRAWAAAVETPFPPVATRPAGSIRPLGADNARWLGEC